MIQLKIEKIVNGGYGLGRSQEGKVVLAHGCLPGELVDVQIYKTKKNYDLGFITKIVKPSPLRVTPVCSSAGECGGCTLQHLPYTEQVDIKQSIFTEDWQRYFGNRVALPKLHFLTAPSPLGYRQRIRLHCIDGNLCFYRHHSRKAIEIETCILANENITTCLEQLEGRSVFQDIKENISELVLHHNPATGQVVVELFFSRKPRPTDLKKVNTLLATPTVQGVRVLGINRELISTVGEGKVIEFIMANSFGTFPLSVTPGDFCQVNMAQNQAMLDYIMSRIDHQNSTRILDLFCGLGNFAIPLAGMGHGVTGIDLKRSSIRRAGQNNEGNNTAATFIRMSAEAGVLKFLKEKAAFDIIILDPPRAGFKEGAGMLPDLHPAKIFYIACDQQTQMRDIDAILEKGYHISEICLVDMFPQTHHLESIVVLERS